MGGLIWEKTDFQSLALKLTSHENDSELAKLLKPIKPDFFICSVISQSCYQTTSLLGSALPGCSQPAFSKELGQGHSMAGVAAGGAAAGIAVLALGQQGTHVTAWWHPQMLCAAWPITWD